MRSIKLSVYQINSEKPIILTDNTDETISSIKKKITDIFKSDSIVILNTSNDCLIIRPDNLKSILITDKESEKIKESTPKIAIKPEKKKIPSTISDNVPVHESTPSTIREAVKPSETIVETMLSDDELKKLNKPGIITMSLEEVQAKLKESSAGNSNQIETLIAKEKINKMTNEE